MKTIDEDVGRYIQQFDPEIQSRLLRIREEIFSLVPDANEALKAR